MSAAVDLDVPADLFKLTATTGVGLLMFIYYVSQTVTTTARYYLTARSPPPTNVTAVVTSTGAFDSGFGAALILANGTDTCPGWSATFGFRYAETSVFTTGLVQALINGLLLLLGCCFCGFCTRSARAGVVTLKQAPLIAAGGFLVGVNVISAMAQDNNTAVPIPEARLSFVHIQAVIDFLGYSFAALAWLRLQYLRGEAAKDVLPVAAVLAVMHMVFCALTTVVLHVFTSKCAALVEIHGLDNGDAGANPCSFVKVGGVMEEVVLFEILNIVHSCLYAYKLLRPHVAAARCAHTNTVTYSMATLPRNSRAAILVMCAWQWRVRAWGGLHVRLNGSQLM